METVSFTTAFIAGILSFLSPCVLPLVPAYISYIAGSTIKEENTTKKMLVKSSLFVTRIFYNIHSSRCDSNNYITNFL